MDIAFPFFLNPVFLILVLVIVLNIFAARNGWGWKPFAFLGGAVLSLALVGILTGLEIVPDGVDIFTFLIGAVVNLGAAIYMLIRKPATAAAAAK